MSAAVTMRAAHDEIIKRAADQGRLLEAGFLAMKVQVLPGASDAAVHSARMIYMAGAQHLFASIMAALDPGTDPTPQDLQRMDLLAAELAALEPQIAAWAAGHSSGPTQ